MTDFAPRTALIMSLHQRGTDFDFRSNIPPDWTLENWQMVAALMLQHIAKNAKVNVRDLYDELGVFVETVDVADILKPQANN